MQKTVFSAITATETSAGINVENLTRISFSVTSAGVSSGTGTLTVDVSNDGTNWETDVAFISSISTTPATRIVSVVTSGDADTKFGFMGTDFSAKMIRFKLTRATDGNYTVVMNAQKVT